MAKKNKTKKVALILAKILLFIFSAWIIAPILVFIGLFILMQADQILPIPMLWFFLGLILFFAVFFSLPLFIFFPAKTVIYIKKKHIEYKKRSLKKKQKNKQTKRRK